MEKIRVAIVEDHEIVRQGIKLILSNRPEISTVGDVGDSVELFKLLKSETPDIILMDIDLPGMSGIEIVKILTNDFPKIKALMLSMSIDENTIFHSLKAGAKGFLHKNVKQQELLLAISEVYSGKEYFSSNVSDIIVKSYADKAKTGIRISDDLENVLTPREIEVLKFLKEGFSNAEIAEKCHISIRTVEGHKDHMKNKLRFKKSTELIKYALQFKF